MNTIIISINKIFSRKYFCSFPGYIYSYTHQAFVSTIRLTTRDFTQNALRTFHLAMVNDIPIGKQSYIFACTVHVYFSIVRWIYKSFQNAILLIINSIIYFWRVKCKRNGRNYLKIGMCGIRFAKARGMGGAVHTFQPKIRILKKHLCFRFG